MVRSRVEKKRETRVLTPLINLAVELAPAEFCIVPERRQELLRTLEPSYRIDHGHDHDNDHDHDHESIKKTMVSFNVRLDFERPGRVLDSYLSNS